MDKNSFSYWIRHNLKDAYSGLIVQDIDYVIIDKQQKIFYIIEEKNSQNARIGPAQCIIFKMINDLLLFNCSLEYVFKGVLLMRILNNNYKNEDIVKQIENMICNYNKDQFNLSKEIIDRLWDCNEEPNIIRTQNERSFYRGSNLSRFIEYYKEKGFLCEHIDWIFVNYCSGNFIFLEEINSSKQINENKNEFISFIDKMFRSTNNNKAFNPKSKCTYKYLGYYNLKFTETNPDNSKIFINGKEIDKQCLINILNLDNDEIKKFL
jgi:hypothetical protein